MWQHVHIQVLVVNSINNQMMKSTTEMEHLCAYMHKCEEKSSCNNNYVCSSLLTVSVAMCEVSYPVGTNAITTLNKK